jgi:hypothetical protein
VVDSNGKFKRALQKEKENNLAIVTRLFLMQSGKVQALVNVIGRQRSP